jgi:hypothetical protein
MRVFSQLQLLFNLETLLGLNTVIPTDHQISIRNALVTFLMNTKLIDCIIILSEYPNPIPYFPELLIYCFSLFRFYLLTMTRMLKPR